MFSPKQCFLYSFFFLCFNAVVAQQSVVDSLVDEVAKLSPQAKDYKKQKANLWHQLLELRIHSGEHDVLLKQIDSLGMLFKELGYEREVMEVSLEKKALVLSTKNRIEALSLYRKYVEYLSKNGWEKENGYLYIDIGNLYLEFKLYKSAANYYKKAEEIFKSQNNKDGLATTYSCLSFSARHLEDFKTSANYAKLGFEIATNKNSDLFSMAYQRFVYGRALGKLKNYDTAKEQLLLALTTFIDSTVLPFDKFGESQNYAVYSVLEIVQVFTETNKTDSMAYYMQFAKDLAFRYNIKNVALKLHLQYIEMRALSMQKKHKEATQLAEFILEQFPSIPSEGHLNQLKFTTLMGISETYGNAGNIGKMYEYYYKAQKLFKSLEENNNNDELLEINNIILQMENEQIIETQQEAIIEKEEIAQKERETRNLVLGILAVLIVVLFLIGALAIELNRRKKTIQNYSLQLEQSDQNKAILLSVIGHDLKAPFNTIFSSLQLLNLNKEKIDSNSQKQLDNLAVASRAAFVMLDDLMQWISVQKDEFKPNFKNNNLPQLIQEILTPIRALAIENQLNILQLMEVEELASDRDMLQIMLRNLVFNAIKHSPIQGEIQLKSYVENEQVCIAVLNKGGHVSETVLNEIKQLQNNRKVAQKGSGLGLLLVQKIAQKMEVELLIENQKGGGVCCVLKFKKGLSYKKSTMVLSTNNNQLSPKYIWTLEEQEYLKELIDKIKKYDIFETTELKNILEINNSETNAVLAWKNNVLQAIYKMDEELLKELLII